MNGSSLEEDTMLGLGNFWTRGPTREAEAPKLTFADRSDAGRQLAEALQTSESLSSIDGDPVVVALPRGGVPVAFEVAQRLGLHLDLLIVRRIGAPGYPDIGIGAVVDARQPLVHIDEASLRGFPLPPGYLDTERQHQISEVDRHHRMYFGEDHADEHDFSGRHVILIDDGISDGGPMEAAIHALRQLSVKTITVAVPVASQDTLDALAGTVDDIVCLSAVPMFGDIGEHYEDFAETTDQDVVRLLKEARRSEQLLN
jgi:predicted phosphoribosyltransferase